MTLSSLRLTTHSEMPPTFSLHKQLAALVGATHSPPPKASLPGTLHTGSSNLLDMLRDRGMHNMHSMGNLRNLKGTRRRDQGAMHPRAMGNNPPKHTGDSNNTPRNSSSSTQDILLKCPTAPHNSKCTLLSQGRPTNSRVIPHSNSKDTDNALLMHAHRARGRHHINRKWRPHRLPPPPLTHSSQ